MKKLKKKIEKVTRFPNHNWGNKTNNVKAGFHQLRGTVQHSSLIFVNARNWWKWKFALHCAELRNFARERT